MPSKRALREVINIHIMVHRLDNFLSSFFFQFPLAKLLIVFNSQCFDREMIIEPIDRQDRHNQMDVQVSI